MKHTPAPWIEGANRRILDQWGNTLAMAFTVIHTIENPVKREVGIEEQEANRRLIAAAPMMLEALKESIDLLESYLCEADREASPTGRWPKLRNAIKQAEGDPTP